LWKSLVRNQRGITCNLADSEGRRVFLELIRSVDFLFESSPVGHMDSLGLSYAALQANNPKLIMVSVTPFGPSGPKADYADSDLIIWAAGGPLEIHRDGEHPPVRISAPQSYLAAGADAAVGALLAHLARLHTGGGQHVVVSAQASVALATICKILAGAVGHPGAAPWGTPPSQPLAPDGDRADLRSASEPKVRGSWPTKDGLIELHLAMGPTAVRSNRLWSWLQTQPGCDLPPLDWCELPRLLEEGALSEGDIRGYRAVITRLLQSKTTDEVLEAAKKWGFVAAPVASIANAATNPHFLAHGLWSEAAPDERQVRVPRAVARVTADAFTADERPAPTIGEHNHAVYRDWLGLSESDLHALERLGAI
jgi:benzylsuccinate CoA-transferase BbsE subunit